MIGERIRIARKAKKYSQEELAKLINTGKTTISNYETGYSRPSPEILNDLADVLGVTTDFLLGRVEVDRVKNPSMNIRNPEPVIESEVDDLGLWFKKGKESSAANREKALEFLEFLEREEKGRKPGDKQK